MKGKLHRVGFSDLFGSDQLPPKREAIQSASQPPHSTCEGARSGTPTATGNHRSPHGDQTKQLPARATDLSFLNLILRSNEYLNPQTRSASKLPNARHQRRADNLKDKRQAHLRVRCMPLLCRPPVRQPTYYPTQSQDALSARNVISIRRLFYKNSFRR